MNWSTNNGPDQVARQENTNLWGIFEAKGGSGQLGTSTLGGGASVQQMSGKWIGHWLDKIIKKNGGELRDDLKAQFDAGDGMLASVVRVDLTPQKATIKITGQIFQPKKGIGMTSWGNA